jgi:uncharacterized protein YndB with AHSA1/START domain
MSAGNTASQMAERELTIERVFNAPRPLVFKAWTESEHMAQWFGPRDFKSTVVKNELRPGGAYRIHMLGPDGDHWMQGIYSEIVPPERLVMEGGWADAHGNLTRPVTILTLTFEDQNGKTKLRLHQTGFESVTARDAHNTGWNSSFDCLAEYLATV